MTHTLMIIKKHVATEYSLIPQCYKLKKSLIFLLLREKSGVSYGSIKRFEKFGKVSFESLLKVAESLEKLDDFENILFPKNNKRYLNQNNRK